MTKIDIAALVADREAGTQGPWVVHEEPEEQIDICAADRPVGRFVPIMSRGMGYNDNVDDESRANARRIARVPDMEAALIAQDAELKRYRGALNAIDAFDPEHLIDGCSAAAARVLLAQTEAANDPEIGPWLRALIEQDAKPPTEYERKVAQMKKDFPNGI